MFVTYARAIRPRLSFMLLSAALLWASSAQAVPIYYEFSGNVTSVNELSSSTVAVGDGFSGQLAYDPTSPFPISPSSVTDVFEFSVSLNDIVFDGGMPGNTSTTFRSSGLEVLGVLGTPTSVEENGVDYLSLVLNFSPFTMTPSTLPVELPVDDFTGGTFTVVGLLASGSFPMITGEFSALQQIDAAQVPETSSLMILLLGLVGVAVMRCGIGRRVSR